MIHLNALNQDCTKMKGEKTNESTEERNGNFSTTRKIELPGLRL